MPGFQHGHIFKIINAKEKFAIEIDERQIRTGKLLVTGLSMTGNAPFQKFKTELLPDTSDYFRILALANPNTEQTLLVWDYMANDRYIMLNKASKSINQIWTTETVYPGNNKIVFIKSHDGMSLRGMGKGEQVELVFHDPSDPCQHWILQPTTSY